MKTLLLSIVASLFLTAPAGFAQEDSPTTSENTPVTAAEDQPATDETPPVVAAAAEAAEEENDPDETPAFSASVLLAPLASHCILFVVVAAAAAAVVVGGGGKVGLAEG